ncbi:MAG: c-type cytochrome [Bradyrhizobium sp.]
MKSLAVFLLVLLPVSAQAAEDGERLFTICRACHGLDPADQGLPGPNLSGVIGRKVGGDPAFDYSPVLRKANADGLRWDAERLDRYLADPAAMFPGLWMAFGGVEDAADRAALVRFLADPASR